MLKRILSLAAIMMIPLFSAGTAAAATVDINGGITRLAVTADLGSLGLSAEATGTARLNVRPNGTPVFRFPITGGTASDAGALIEHDGVGVRLFAGEAEATVGDFLIDTAAASILGTVNGGSDFIALFDLGETRNNGRIEVLINENLAGALISIFDAPDLTGALFGLARVSPEVSEVPLPASSLLLLAGVGAFAGLRRKQRKAA